jgi:uncharacterized protein
MSRRCYMHRNATDFYGADSHTQRFTPRTDGYVRETEPDGTIVEEYRRSGELHRDDGPARIEHHADGSLIEGYYRDGKLHRDDGPARIERQASGSTVEEYYRNDKLHREDSPRQWRAQAPPR